MNTLFYDKLKGGLIWLPQCGIGWYPVQDQKADYFDHYDGLKTTPIAKELNTFRVEFVERHFQGTVLDVGVGDGSFIRTRLADCTAATFGYDIDPKAVTWLETNNVWDDPFEEEGDCFRCMTFWDSLEHIEEPGRFLNLCTSWVFVSIPIFENGDAVLASKHFKPAEHRWYFTRSGFIGFMAGFGFDCKEVNATETNLGREGIMSFAFKKRA